MGTTSFPQTTVRLGLGAHDAFVHKCDHIAYFWETEKEFAEAVGFIVEGLKNRDHCVIFGYEEANQKVLKYLNGRGFNVARLIAETRVTVLSAAQDGDATLASIGATFQEALTKGAKLIRLLGNIGWNRPHWPAENDIMAFEAKVTEAACAFPCVVICMYDVRALPGHIIVRGGLETHPVTIRGNVVRVNPYHIPPAEFLDRLQREKRSKRTSPGKRLKARKATSTRRTKRKSVGNR
ncbi:MAG TPA: MEDS domain-containing protein [Terriglobales bacterium]|nr:MEDS domain-containing protein [Terriglobales bacterium]